MVKLYHDIIVIFVKWYEISFSNVKYVTHERLGNTFDYSKGGEPATSFTHQCLQVGLQKGRNFRLNFQKFKMGNFGKIPNLRLYVGI